MSSPLYTKNVLGSVRLMGFVRFILKTRGITQFVLTVNPPKLLVGFDIPPEIGYTVVNEVQEAKLGGL